MTHVARFWAAASRPPRGQRLVCEVGYACLYKAGFRRGTLKGRRVGSWLGDVGPDPDTPQRARGGAGGRLDIVGGVRIVAAMLRPGASRVMIGLGCILAVSSGVVVKVVDGGGFRRVAPGWIVFVAVS